MSRLQRNSKKLCGLTPCAPLAPLTFAQRPKVTFKAAVNPKPLLRVGIDVLFQLRRVASSVLRELENRVFVRLPLEGRTYDDLPSPVGRSKIDHRQNRRARPARQRRNDRR